MATTTGASEAPQAAPQSSNHISFYPPSVYILYPPSMTLCPPVSAPLGAGRFQGYACLIVAYSRQQAAYYLVALSTRLTERVTAACPS